VFLLEESASKIGGRFTLGDSRIFQSFEAAPQWRMHIEIRYKWRIKWGGRWTTTNHYATEDQIRKEHPEAVRLDNMRIEQQLLDTPEERVAAIGRSHYDGKMAWEKADAALVGRTAREKAEREKENKPPGGAGAA
jgi:hypothetical protein